MPIKITKYTCQFKCGHKALSDVKRMEAHENNFCFKNPENKTCATCVNAIYESDSDDYTWWYGRGCKIDILNEFLEEVQEDLTIEPSKHIKPLFHCPNHNLSEQHELIEVFIEQVRKKIETKRESILESNNPVRLPF